MINDNVSKRNIYLNRLHHLIQDKTDDREFQVMHLLIARDDRTNDRKNTAIHRTIKILEMAKGRSVHFPKLICYGRLRKVKFVK